MSTYLIRFLNTLEKDFMMKSMWENLKYFKWIPNCFWRECLMNWVKIFVISGVIVNFLVKEKIKVNLEFDLLGIDQ